MSIKRHKILIASLQFDNSQTRAQRKQSEKAAATISEVFNEIISVKQPISHLSLSRSKKCAGSFLRTLWILSLHTEKSQEIRFESDMFNRLEDFITFKYIYSYRKRQ